MGKIKINRTELNNLIKEGVAEALAQGGQYQAPVENPFSDEIRNISYLAERLEVYAQTLKEDYIPAIEGKYQDAIEALNTVLGEEAYNITGIDTDYDREVHVGFKVNSYDGFKKHITEGNYRCVRYALEDTASEENIESITSENYQMLLEKTLADEDVAVQLVSDVLAENLYDSGRGPVTASFSTFGYNSTITLEIEIPFDLKELSQFIEGGE